jgi:cystathionine beta-lyase/cystathionine gamma-synthase
MDCYLTLRGIKTLAVRVDRACANAERIAHWLRAHPKVKEVRWPGFPDHPGHETAKRQMSGFGAMVSFTLADDSLQNAFDVMSRTKVFTLAESLGGVESLISHPASMTHASIPADQRRAAGLNDSLIRLSVGIEDAADLIDDLERAIG